MSNPVCPFARQRPLARAMTKPLITPTASAAHTAVSGANGQELGDFFEKVQDDAHFYVDHDGTLWQYQPVNRKSWAQYHGNDHAVSYETWDGGNPATPWNAAQIATIVRLLVWLHAEWGISLAAATVDTGGGFAYHSQFPSWNLDSHQCPGPVRVAQLFHDVIPLARTPTAPPEADVKPGTKTVTVTCDAATGKGYADVPGVPKASVLSWSCLAADDGTVASVGLSPTAALNGDAIVCVDLGRTGAATVICVVAFNP